MLCYDLWMDLVGRAIYEGLDAIGSLQETLERA